MAESAQAPSLQWQSLASVVTKLGSGGRVRYSCMDCSSTYLVFGTNTGTLYFYERHSLRFLTLLSSKEIRDPILVVKVNPQGSQLALGTKGGVWVMEADPFLKRDKDRFRLRWTPRDVPPIRTATWSPPGKDGLLVWADEGGTVYGWSANGKREVEVLLKGEGLPVQLSLGPTDLAVSTVERVQLLHLPSLASVPVGSQPRQGRYGAVITPLGQVLAARPGRRVWVADLGGRVRQTLTFKAALSLAPRSLLPPGDSPASSLTVQGVQFALLLPWMGPLLVAWESNAVFLIDLSAIAILEWFTDFQQIQEICVEGNSLYILHDSSKSVSRLFLPVSATPSPPISPPTSSSSSRAPEKPRESPQESSREAPKEGESALELGILKDLSNEHFPVPHSGPLQPIKRRKPKRKAPKVPEILSSSSSSVPFPSLGRSSSSEQLGEPGPSLGHRKSLSHSEPLRAPRVARELPLQLAVVDMSTEIEPPPQEGVVTSVERKITQQVLESVGHVTGQVDTMEKKLSQQLEGWKKLRADPSFQPLSSNFRRFRDRVAESFTKDSNSPEPTKKKDPVGPSLPLAVVEEREEEGEESFTEFTRTTFEALFSYRREKRKGVGTLEQIIHQWLQEYEGGGGEGPSSWVTEILTSYWELKCSGEGRAAWEEGEGLQFLERHGAALHGPRVVAAANGAGWAECLQWLSRRELLSRDDSLPLPSAAHLLKKRLLPASALGALPSLLLSDPALAVEVSVGAYPLVLPANLRSLQRSHPSEYQRYLSLLFAAHPESATGEWVKEWCESCLLDSPPPPHRLFEASAPKRLAHLEPWKHHSTLLGIVGQPERYKVDPEDLILLCLKHGFFPGLLVLYRTSPQHSFQALDLLLALDAVEEFHQHMAQSYDKALWKYLLLQMESLPSSPPRLLSKEVVVKQMIVCLGVTESVELLQDRKDFIQDLPVSSWEYFLSQGDIETEQAALRLSVLETLDSYLWTPRPSALPPQLRAVLEAEQGQELDRLPFLAEDTALAQWRERFDSSLPLPRFLEDRQTHWGVVLPWEDERCGVCTLPVAQGSGNVVLFPCGHPFHELCLAGLDACTLCVSVLPF